MILGCRLDHLRGQNVLVNGNTYRVGDNGIVTDMPDADAWKLLASPTAWFRVGAMTGDSGPMDYTREIDTPAHMIPRDSEGKLRALELPDILKSDAPKTPEDAAQDKAILAEWAAYEKRHPGSVKPSPTAVMQRVVASDANQPESDQTPTDAAPTQPIVQAAPISQAAAPGAGNTPGIPPVEAPDQIAPAKRKRGRPARKKEL